MSEYKLDPVGYLHKRPERIPCFFESYDDAMLSGCEAVPAYTQPQPAPDVAGLVEALQACRDELMWMIERHNQQDQNDASWLYDYQTVVEADAALAAYRKGGRDNG